MSKVGIVAEFLEFVKYRKKYWMLPIFIVLMLLAALTFFIYAYPYVAPFIYPVG